MSERFLKKYIQDNADVPLEEVLDDEEFLEELQLKDNIFISL